nr:glycoside hydrolase family 95 protein [Bacteroidales bacterium]
MRKLSYLLCLLTAFCCLRLKAAENKEHLLWYDDDAKNWNEALPLGNGHLGAMVYGSAQEELIRLNDNTLYTGEPATVWKVHNIQPTYDKVVDLLMKGEYTEAYDLVHYHWLGRLHENYQPLGDWHISNLQKGEISNYHRELDIEKSLMRITYTQNGVNYCREIFASYPDDVIVMKLTADKANALDISIALSSPHKPTTSYSIDKEKHIVQMSGQGPGHGQRRSDAMIKSWKAEGRHPELYFADGSRKYKEDVLYGDQINGMGTFFETRLQAIAPDASFEVIESKDKFRSQSLRISNTDEIVLILASETSFNGYKKSPSREGKDAKALVEKDLAKAAATSYQDLLKRHQQDYQALFGRVQFNMPAKSAQQALPTDDRIVAFWKEYDNGLVSLMFNYGRYLMISASRPGGQAMNLQGIWNDKIMPPWNCGYTLNINAEMNYWPAEIANLSECAEPFFQMIEELAESGSKTAKEMYGRNGWVAHHNSSIWRETHPNDGTPTSSYWPMAPAWLCSHLWEHYLYTGDVDFLREKAYPIMKGAAEFLTEWLVDNGEGYLVTPVSNSPENTFIMPGEKFEYDPSGHIMRKPRKSAISMGSTMDMSLIRELFSRCIQAGEILDTDQEFCGQLQAQLDKLLPYRIGARAQLQEWQQDFDEYEPHHRHVSHLYGLHPGNQISYDATPELFQACMRSLELRGDEATGWSMGWKINLWARLLDGDHANIIVRNLFNPVGFGDKSGKGGGGIYPNMLDAHSPFQIDGNFGYTAGIIEMLMQSHAGFLQLLPALPSIWPEGEIKGIKARGGFVLDISWKDGKLSQARIHSTLGGNCRLRYDAPLKVQGAKTKTAKGENPNPYYGYVEVSDIQNNAEHPLLSLPKKDYYTIDFETKKGKTYVVSLK